MSLQHDTVTHDERDQPHLLLGDDEYLHKEQLLTTTTPTIIMTAKTATTATTVIQWIKWLLTSQIFAHLLLFFNQLLFGGFYVLGPLALKHWNSVLFASLRTMIMFTGTIPLSLAVDWKYSFRDDIDRTTSFSVKNFIWSKIPHRRDLLLLACLGTILSACIYTYIISLGLTSPITISIITPTQTVFTCVLAILLKKEGRSILKLLGVAFAVIGAIAMLLITAWAESGTGSGKGAAFSLNVNSLIGCGIMLFNSVLTACYIILQKTLLDRKIPPFTVTCYSLFFSSCIAVVVSIYYFVTDFHPLQIPRIAWVGLLYSGVIVGTFSFTMIAFAARISSPTIVAIYGPTAPIISALFLYIFLRQTITPLVTIGAVLITIGVFMVGYAKRQESVQAEKDKLQMQESDQEEIIVQEEEMHECEEAAVRTDDSFVKETTDKESLSV